MQERWIPYSFFHLDFLDEHFVSGSYKQVQSGPSVSTTHWPGTSFPYLSFTNFLENCALCFFQPIELVDQKIKRSYNMDAKEAIKFGVADKVCYPWQLILVKLTEHRSFFPKILWRGSRELGQKAMTASEYDAQLKAGAMNVRKPSPVMK